MPRALTSYRVFIASPGGLEEERQTFRDVIDKFNDSAAIHDGIHFEAVGWEETLGGIGRPQSLINEDLSTCDFFIMLLCDRWGSPPGDINAQYTSGTQEEYEVALKCYAASTMNQIIVLFKKVDEKQLNDPGPQLQKVIEFRKKLEKERTLLFQNFDSINGLKDLLNKYLQLWLRWGRETSKDVGSPPQFSGQTSGPSLEPINDSLSEWESSLGSADQSVALAWQLANEGKLTEAEIEFSRVVINLQTPETLMNYGEFLVRLGLLGRAQSMFEEALILAQKRQDKQGVAHAYENLGSVIRRLGDFNSAEERYRSSLTIYEQLGNLSGMASQYSNLGNILLARGDLAGAEEMHRKSLAIEEKLDNAEGMASQYGNLGNVLQTRGDLDGAEEMHRKSLSIEEKLGNAEGMASDYGNLGIVLRNRGDLTGAEEMYRKSLVINEKLGRLEAKANDYGNLAVVFRNRGDLASAEEMIRKSIKINEQIGNLEGLANQYGNLGVVLDGRKDLDGAEEMYRKSLSINEQLGRIQGMGSQYGNLGTILQQRGNLDGAEEMYLKSLAISEKNNRILGMFSQYGNLGSLFEERGDLKAAEEMYNKSLTLAQQLKAVHLIEQTQQLLDKLKDRKGE